MKPTRMQLAALNWADMPRDLVAKRLGLKSPQAVSMRIRRARDRMRREPLSRPLTIRQPGMIATLPITLDRLALSA